MKKGYIFIIVILLVLLFFYTQDSKVKNYPPKNNIIVAFGDSLIEGQGASKGNDFVSLLSKKLKKPIINLGVPGNTTADGLARIDEVINYNPGTVIILFGGNDYLQSLPERETFQNLRTIVSNLQNKGIFIVLLGIRGGLLNDRFENQFERLKEEFNVVYVPNVLSGLLGNQQYMSDAVHPNDLGYEKITDNVYKVIDEYIF